MARCRTVAVGDLALDSKRCSRGLDGTGNTIGRNVEMSHGSDGGWTQNAEPHTISGEGAVGEAVSAQAGSGHIEDHDVGLDLLWIEGNARQLGESLCQEAGSLVIFGQSVDMMAKGVDSGSGDDPACRMAPPNRCL